MNIQSMKIINCLEVIRTLTDENKPEFFVKFQSESKQFNSNAEATKFALNHSPDTAFLKEKPKKKAKKAKKDD